MNMKLLTPANGANVSLHTTEQKAFFTDPERFVPHELQLIPHSDQTVPRPIVFSWTARPDTEAFLQISLDPEFRQLVVNRKAGITGQTGSAGIYNLLPGKTYFWRVASGGAISETASFSVIPELPRWIAIPGATNVRDLGGWRTPDGKAIRMGMIFRGSQFEPEPTLSCGLQEAGRKEIIHTLGIRTELDLRGEKENILSRKARRFDCIRYERFPMQAYATWAETGIFSAEQTEYLRNIFQLLADDSIYPVYLHCAGGGDRTGTIVFLLEALLGLDMEDILTEYELSNLSVSGERSRFSEVWTKFMEKLQTFGTESDSLACCAVHFLRRCEVPDETMAKIRNLLLTDHCLL